MNTFHFDIPLLTYTSLLFLLFIILSSCFDVSFFPYFNFHKHHILSINILNREIVGVDFHYRCIPLVALFISLSHRLFIYDKEKCDAAAMTRKQVQCIKCCDQTEIAEFKRCDACIYSSYGTRLASLMMSDVDR